MNIYSFLLFLVSTSSTVESSILTSCIDILSSKGSAILLSFDHGAKVTVSSRRHHSEAHHNPQYALWSVVFTFIPWNPTWESSKSRSTVAFHFRPKCRIPPPILDTFLWTPSSPPLYQSTPPACQEIPDGYRFSTLGEYQAQCASTVSPSHSKMHVIPHRFGPLDNSSLTALDYP